MRIETDVMVEAQAGHIKRTLLGYEPLQPPEVEVGGLYSLDSKVQAERLLLSAEQAGGKKFRESTLNDCRISGVLARNEWTVFYNSLADNTKWLVLTFDATTGGVKEVRTPSIIATPSK